MRKRNGFTLIELLVVTAVIAILMAILMPALHRASRYLIARKVKTCAAEPVAQRLQQTIGKLPASKRRSLKLDNSREFARPAELKRRLILLQCFWFNAKNPTVLRT